MQEPAVAREVDRAGRRVEGLASDDERSWFATFSQGFARRSVQVDYRIAFSRE